jgi:hypothetical protein
MMRPAMFKAVILLVAVAWPALANRQPSTQPPTEPYQGTPDYFLCNNLCMTPRDGECDDGGPGSLTSICPYGSDCADCTNGVPRPPYTRTPTSLRITRSPTTIWVPPPDTPAPSAARTNAPVSSGGFETTSRPTTRRPTTARPTTPTTRSPTPRPSQAPSAAPSPAPTKRPTRRTRNRRNRRVRQG